MTRYAILHEGSAKKTADNALIKQLMEVLGLDLKQVDFYAMGTKSNFFKPECPEYINFFPSLKAGGITKALFILDADDPKNDSKYGGRDNTEREIKAFFQQQQITPYCDIYITCDPTTGLGYLESFILSTIPDEQKKCINNFLACSDFKSKENAKSILNQVYKIAYPQAPYDFSHAHFDELKQKLLALFQS